MVCDIWPKSLGPQKTSDNGHMVLLFPPTSNLSCLVELKVCHLIVYFVSQLKKKRNKKPCHLKDKVQGGEQIYSHEYTQQFILALFVNY